MGRLAACLLAAALASGCFAFDEIDKGQEVMDQHYGQAAKKKQGDAPEKPAEQPGPMARLKGWLEEQWSSLRQRAERAEEGGSPPPHPDDTLVACTLDGTTRFMRKFDCQLRGGTFRDLAGSASR